MFISYNKNTNISLQTVHPSFRAKDHSLKVYNNLHMRNNITLTNLNIDTHETNFELELTPTGAHVHTGPTCHREDFHEKSSHLKASHK